MVEFVDGSVKAQLGVPDMMLPIQCALTYPDRDDAEAPRIDWDVSQQLEFEPVDETLFPALSVAREAARRGMSYPAVLCGADEAAVELFLQDELRFTEIAAVVRDTLAAHDAVEEPSVEQLFAVERWARETVMSRVHGVARNHYTVG
jgi:1-deoxy-D-xylulose-5-phosphate reductoisomerase